MKKSFTLIELLIVLVISGILATLAVPVFKEATAKANLSTLMLELNRINKEVQICKMETGWARDHTLVQHMIDFFASGELQSHKYYYVYGQIYNPDPDFNTYEIWVSSEYDMPRLLCVEIVSQSGIVVRKIDERHPWAKYLQAIWPNSVIVPDIE